MTNTKHPADVLAAYCESLAWEIDHSHFTHDLRESAAMLRQYAALEKERDALQNEVGLLRAELEAIKAGAQIPADMAKAVSAGLFNMYEPSAAPQDAQAKPLTDSCDHAWAPEAPENG